MARLGIKALRGGIPAALLLGSATLIALPTAGLAIGAVSVPSITRSDDSFGGFTPASIDPRLAELVASRSRKLGDNMRFTPAGIPSRTDGAVTVAVRVNGDAAHAISIRSAIGDVNDKVSGAVALAPTRYNLGISRGYQGFAKPQAPKLSVGLGSIEMPDLAAFKPEEAGSSKPSRFNARLSLEEQASRGPRPAEALSNQTVDLGGSYRVTRNLDVTAGVRYSQDRDPIAPLIDGEQDSQAVYVGTQFRF